MRTDDSDGMAYDKITPIVISHFAGIKTEMLMSDYNNLGRTKGNLSVGRIMLMALLILAGMLLLTSCSSVKNIQVTKACKDALNANQSIDASKLTCNVKDGVAYVSGTVYTEAERDLVVEILKGVEGVVDVRATLEIEEGGEKNPAMLWF